MQRSKVNHLVDATTMLGVIGLIASGLVLEWVLPPGSGGRGGGSAKVLWTGTRHDWGDIHFYIACSLAVLLLLHIALHWTWICTLTLRIIGFDPTNIKQTALRRNVAGAICFALVVAGFAAFIWIALSNVELREPTQEGRGRRQRNRWGQSAALRTMDQSPTVVDINESDEQIRDRDSAP